MRTIRTIALNRKNTHSSRAMMLEQRTGQSSLSLIETLQTQFGRSQRVLTRTLTALVNGHKQRQVGGASCLGRRRLIRLARKPTGVCALPTGLPPLHSLHNLSEMIRSCGTSCMMCCSGAFSRDTRRSITGFFSVCEPIEHQATYVQLVVQNSGPSSPMASDRCSSPSCARRAAIPSC